MALTAEEEMELLELLEQEQYHRERNKLFTYYPDTGPLRRELYKKHTLFFRLGNTHGTRCFMAGNRIGKALKNGTRVATPDGWRTIEELRVGDKVIAGDGSITPVLGVYPQGEVDLYSLMFDGRNEVVACGEHLWVYQHPRARYPDRRSHKKTEANPFYGEWSVGNTKSLMEFGASAKRRAVVPASNPWSFDEKDLPLDPYILGLLIGDGGLSRDSIKFSTADDELLTAVSSAFKVSSYGGYNYGVLGAVPVIRELGLLGLTSEHKFIPPVYMTSSIEQRLALMQGLMDTDGSIHGPGATMEFSTSSDRLAEDFALLGVSLGFKMRVERRHTKAQNGNGLPSWRIHLRTGSVCPFRLGRKVERFRPLKETRDWVLHSVTPAGRGQATCIEVAHESHTYVIEHGIVTHNTEGAGGYELTLHLTGRYPEWWEGARFDAPIRAWAAGDTGKTVREIIQEKLLGPWMKIGTGLIPGDDIVRKTIKVGVAEAIDTLWVKHYDLNGVYDGDSCLVFKSYDQGREAFQGTEQDVIWLDEEANDSIRNECVLRLMTTNGLLIETFTPLRGITPVVMQYLPNGDVTADCEVGEDKALIMAGWDDVPHLGESEKRRMLAETAPHLRDARSKGIPSLGAGAIYPVPESEIKVMDFQIPEHWPRIYALDVGWNRTAAVWGAWDKDSDTIYLVAEHYRGQAEPAIHAHAIRSKGEWIPGEIDPASRGRAQKDGEQLLRTYKDLGLILGMANNGVESGIYEVWQRLSTGRLKVFASLSSWFSEYRIYRRDEKGRIVKENDHLMDATRYLVAAKPSRWKTRPVRVEPVSSWQPKDSGMGY